jgi:hypothetical protein
MYFIHGYDGFGFQLLYAVQQPRAVRRFLHHIRDDAIARPLRNGWGRGTRDGTWGRSGCTRVGRRRGTWDGTWGRSGCTRVGRRRGTWDGTWGRSGCTRVGRRRRGSANDRRGESMAWGRRWTGRWQFDRRGKLFGHAPSFGSWRRGRHIHDPIAKLHFNSVLRVWSPEKKRKLCPASSSPTKRFG